MAKTEPPVTGSGPTNEADHGIGYSRPPVATRFKPGVSGNPKGRPRGRRTGLPYEVVLGQLVTIREDGRERRVTAAEAFLLHMAKSGLAGNGAAARASMAAIATARAARSDGDGLIVVIRSFASTQDAIAGLRALAMVRTLDAHRPTARLKIEPWLVQAALDRLGDRRLTLVEQAEVWRATRTPRKVVWPAWWELTPDLLAAVPISPRPEPKRNYDEDV